MGDVMHEIERIVGGQMIEKHDMQKGEVMALISKYIDVHYPGAVEEYEDGTRPVEYYGHRDWVKNAGR